MKIGKIKSMECIKNDEHLEFCCHLSRGVYIDNKYIPFYCKVKKKQIIFPGGKRKCKYYEVRITQGMLGTIDMRKEKI